MMQAFTDPAVIIGLLTALGAGTIIQQLLNRRKTRTDVDVALTAMAREVAAELRQDNQGLREQLDRTESELREIKAVLSELSYYASQSYLELRTHRPDYPPPPSLNVVRGKGT